MAMLWCRQISAFLSISGHWRESAFPFSGRSAEGNGWPVGPIRCPRHPVPLGVAVVVARKFEAVKITTTLTQRFQRWEDGDGRVPRVAASRQPWAVLSQALRAI
jgi:hypothetical protein